MVCVTLMSHTVLCQVTAMFKTRILISAVKKTGEALLQLTNKTATVMFAIECNKFRPGKSTTIPMSGVQCSLQDRPSLDDPNLVEVSIQGRPHRSSNGQPCIKTIRVLRDLGDETEEEASWHKKLVAWISPMLGGCKGRPILAVALWKSYPGRGTMVRLLQYVPASADLLDQTCSIEEVPAVSTWKRLGEDVPSYHCFVLAPHLYDVDCTDFPAGRQVADVERTVLSALTERACKNEDTHW